MLCFLVRISGFNQVEKEILKNFIGNSFIMDDIIHFKRNRKIAEKIWCLLTQFFLIIYYSKNFFVHQYVFESRFNQKVKKNLRLQNILMKLNSKRRKGPFYFAFLKIQLRVYVSLQFLTSPYILNIVVTSAYIFLYLLTSSYIFLHLV